MSSRFGVDALGVYWPVAGPAGGGLTGWYYHRRELRVGLARAGGPYVAVAAFIVVGASLAGGVASARGSELAAALAPFVVVAVGYLAFAWLERSTVLALVSVALTALVAVLAGAGLGAQRAALVMAVAAGTILVATGAWQRTASSHP